MSSHHPMQPMQKYEMLAPDEEKLSESLGWPLFHDGERVASSTVRTVYTCESLADPYQAPLQVNDECGSMRKAFRTDALRPAALKAQLLQRVNRIAWHENLARLKRNRNRFMASSALQLASSVEDKSANAAASTPISATPTPINVSGGNGGNGGNDGNGTNGGRSVGMNASAATTAVSAALTNELVAMPTPAEAFPLLRLSTVANSVQIDMFFTRLASTVTDDPLAALSALLQHGFPKDLKLIEALVSRLVPLSRAIWLLRILALSGTARATALSENVVKALLARISQPPPVVPSNATPDAIVELQTNDMTRTLYLIRLVEWMLAERLSDDKLIFQTLVTEMEATVNAPRKTAILCYLLQPVLARLVRLPPNAVESQLVTSMLERLQQLHTVHSLNGPLARGLRVVLRTALISHPLLATSALLTDPQRRQLLYQLSASPTVSQSPSGTTSVSLPVVDLNALQSHASPFELKPTSTAAWLSGERQARELQVADSVALPWLVLGSLIVDRLPIWLDSFAGSVRLKKQLAPLGPATHLGDRRFASVFRRALEWSVTPERGGRDRPYVTGVAIDVLLDVAGVQQPALPSWVQAEILRFVEDCVSFGPSFADFNALVRLMGELFRRRVLPYTAYHRMLISRGWAPQLSTQTVAAAMLVIDDDDNDDDDELGAASSVDSLRIAAEVAAASMLSKPRADEACVRARHAYIVRQTPILDRAGDNNTVRSDCTCRAHMLLARKTLEESVAQANGLICTFLEAVSTDIAPAASSMLSNLALHEQTCVAKETAACCIKVWATLTPPRLLWAIALIEQVGCVVTLVDTLLALVQHCARDSKPSTCEATLLDVLKRNEAAFVWCDRALELRNVLARQPRFRAIGEAFQHRFEGALPSPNDHQLSMKPGARKVVKQGAAGALQMLLAPELPRAFAACLAPNDITLPRTPLDAHNAFVGGIAGALLPLPAIATECAVVAGRDVGDRITSLQVAARSGAFKRLLGLAPVDAPRTAAVAPNDESGDGATLSADATAFVDAHTFPTSLLRGAVDWRVALPRAVLTCVLRATPWNIVANASVLRACCDAAASDNSYVDSLPNALPPQNTAILPTVARVYRSVARAALAAGVVYTSARVRDGISNESATVGWSLMRLLLMQAGGMAVLGAVLRELLIVLSDDAVIHHTPYRLPTVLLGLLSDTSNGTAPETLADIALYDAVSQGLLRLLLPVIRDLRSSTAPSSLLSHTYQQLALQLRKWHAVTTSYVDVIAVTDENLRALHSALVLRLELVAGAISPIRMSHSNCSRDCVCGWQVLFDVLTDVATNGLVRVGAADDDTLMLLCTGAIHCLTDRITMTPARDVRLGAALQRTVAVPPFFDAEEAAIRASDDRRKLQQPWALVEGFTPLQSILGADSLTLHARTPPRYACIVQPTVDASLTTFKRVGTEESLNWKRSRRS